MSKKSYADLLQSFENFDYVELITVNADNTILAGHQRIHIMKDLKWEDQEIEVRVPNRLLTKKEGEEYLIRSNKNVGEFDYDLLANEWEIDDLCNYGFTLDELGIDLNDPDNEEESSGNETLEPIPDDQSSIKVGDFFKLNNHRLICGNSTNQEIVEKVLDGNKPILMITDPPYGVNYDPAWRKDIKGKKGAAARAMGKVQNDGQVDWSSAWKLFPGSIAYVWHAGKYCGEVEKSLTESEFEIISQIIWVKQHFALSRGDYHWQHEPCWYAVKKGESHNWQGSRKECTVWEISNLNAFGEKEKEGDERTSHSTQKPLQCMSKPILNNTAEEDYVYDPFLGSGTTLIAAEKLNRKCIGIELSPGYCEVIINRWIEFMNKNNKEFTIEKNDEPYNASST